MLCINSKKASLIAISSIVGVSSSGSTNTVEKAKSTSSISVSGRSSTDAVAQSSFS